VGCQITEEIPKCRNRLNTQKASAWLMRVAGSIILSDTIDTDFFVEAAAPPNPLPVVD
jgi:uncharacterized PurR-regulated membrane protein YhhQ (DUF165 family)